MGTMPRLINRAHMFDDLEAQHVSVIIMWV